MNGKGCVRVAPRIMHDDPLVVDVGDGNEVIGTCGAVRAGLMSEKHPKFRPLRNAMRTVPSHGSTPPLEH